MASRFKELFGSEPSVVAAAPGRVNLIGEHTDYNDGWVLPMALDSEIYVAARARPDSKLMLHSLDYKQGSEWNLKSLQPRPGKGWDNYVAAVYWALQKEGYHLGGADILLKGDLPQGTGLSSSAALELCVARAAAALGAWKWDPVAMALLGQKAENEFIGVRCGIMDQMAVAACEPGCALLLDCRKLKMESIPVNFKGAVFVVSNSNVKRELKSSAYNERREQCEEAFARLARLKPGLANLSAATPELLAEAGEPDALWHRRARHVLSENARVLKGVEALRRGDAMEFGRLMNASHDSLRDDYEVSCSELDALVAAARAQRGCFGSRLTGAGFGGCTVSLVEAAAVDSFEKGVQKLYTQSSGLKAEIYRFQPGHPTRLL
jgi:galactokinase